VYVPPLGEVTLKVPSPWRFARPPVPLRIVKWPWKVPPAVLAVDANRRVPEAPATVPVKANLVCPTSTVRPWAVVNAVDVWSIVPLRPPVKARVIIDVTRVLGPAVLVVMSLLLVKLNVPVIIAGAAADAVGRRKRNGSARSMTIFFICLTHLLSCLGTFLILVSALHPWRNVCSDVC
jgi:hypothetical protein